MASESNVSVSKSDLHNAASAIEQTATEGTLQGVEHLEEAASDFDAAGADSTAVPPSREMRNLSVLPG